MVLRDPWGYDGKTYDGAEMRMMVESLAGSDIGGVAGLGDLQVVQQSSPASTVRMAAGSCVIPATGAGLFGSFAVSNDGYLTSPTVTPTGGSLRWDVVILQVVAGVPQIVIVQGTPGVSAEPSLAGYDNYIKLARLEIPTSTTNITTAMIMDQRMLSDKVVICTSTTRPALGYVGQLLVETDTDAVYAWKDSTPGWWPVKPAIPHTNVDMATGAGGSTTSSSYVALPVNVEVADFDKHRSSTAMLITFNGGVYNDNSLGEWAVAVEVNNGGTKYELCRGYGAMSQGGMRWLIGLAVGIYDLQLFYKRVNGVGNVVQMSGHVFSLKVEEVVDP